MSGDRHIIVGVPPTAELIAGSRVYACSACGCDVAFAPTGQRMISAGAVPVCIPCGSRLAAEAGAMPEPPTREQVAEIAGHRRRN